MERSGQVLRDYGMALLLVTASLVLFFTTMKPQMDRNRELDRMYQEQQARAQAEQFEVQRLEAIRAADWDPLVVERLARELFQSLGLPEAEQIVPSDPNTEES